MHRMRLHFTNGHAGPNSAFGICNSKTAWKKSHGRINDIKFGMESDFRSMVCK